MWPEKNGVIKKKCVINDFIGFKWRFFLNYLVMERCILKGVGGGYRGVAGTCGKSRGCGPFGRSGQNWADFKTIHSYLFFFWLVTFFVLVFFSVK